MEVQELKDIIRKKTLARESTSLLKYVLAESERYSKSPINVIEKLIIDNKKTFEQSGRQEFLEENKVLAQYLPKYLTVNEIIENIGGLSLDNTGQTMGILMKLLKAKNLAAKSEDIRTALSMIANIE